MDSLRKAAFICQGSFIWRVICRQCLNGLFCLFISFFSSPLPSLVLGIWATEGKNNQQQPDEKRHGFRWSGRLYQRPRREGAQGLKGKKNCWALSAMYQGLRKDFFLARKSGVWKEFILPDKFETFQYVFQEQSIL